MKKTRRKLVLRNQAIRVLAHIDLALAVGGSDPALADTGAKACSTESVAIATATCR